MEKLQDLSQSELQELLDNPERVESMAQESDEIQNIQLEREMALASNRSLAEENLDMKPRLESQKEVLVARYSDLEEVRETYRHHCSLRDGMMAQVSREALLSRLQTESGKTEAESEALADQFLEGSVPLESFMERFLSLRALAHKRRVRIEKLQELQRPKNHGPAVTAAADPQTHTATDQPNSKPSSYQNASQPPVAVGLPYSPYPVPVCAASNPAPQFGPPFRAPGGYPSPRPAFGAQPAVSCPYPAQPSFPTPHPGSAFAPLGGSAPYPASYSYGGYSYPTGPPGAQSPTARPMYRPGYGVPQPFS